MRTGVGICVIAVSVIVKCSGLPPGVVDECYRNAPYYHYITEKLDTSISHRHKNAQRMNQTTLNKTHFDVGIGQKFVSFSQVLLQDFYFSSQFADCGVLEQKHPDVISHSRQRPPFHIHIKETSISHSQQQQKPFHFHIYIKETSIIHDKETPHSTFTLKRDLYFTIRSKRPSFHIHDKETPIPHSH